MQFTIRSGNFIGEYFRQNIKQRGVNRKILAERLGFKYANNLRMICAYLSKKDYLWEQFEVENWCNALMISKNSNIYKKLMEKAGKKKYDYFDKNEEI